MNGYLGNLSEAQTLALNSFKEKLEKCCSEQPKIQKAIEEWRALANKYGEVIPCHYGSSVQEDLM